MIVIVLNLMCLTHTTFQAMEELEAAETRIIIVNVDEQYAPALVKTAEKLGLNAKHGYMWIWRGWPFRDDVGATVSLFLDIRWHTLIAATLNCEWDMFTIMVKEFLIGVRY